ncbi:MAG: hypothetical protein HYV34_00380 [Candidatus Kerfeldbacteria bacterium]|nr:hypothetical protein [Candidatus Kerfeldbacteria bacterium]
MKRLELARRELSFKRYAKTILAPLTEATENPSRTCQYDEQVLREELHSALGEQIIQTHDLLRIHLGYFSTFLEALMRAFVTSLAQNTHGLASRVKDEPPPYHTRDFFVNEKHRHANKMSK